MKYISLSISTNYSRISQFGLKLGSGISAVAILCALATIPSALAANRVVQLLGRCGLAKAEYLGNRKHGDTALSSFSPDGEAGIVLEGVEGRTISELKSLFIAYEPPKTPAYNFLLRIKVAGDPVNKIQNFTIGPDSNPSLPNIPGQDEGDGMIAVNINPNDLLGGKSNLTGNSVVQKVSFIFSNKQVSSQTLFVDQVRYNLAQVYVLLEPVTCNLK